MANILYRGSASPAAVNTAGGANRALTNLEIDQNFFALDRDKIQLGANASTLALTAGDILYVSAANTLSKLPVGTNGQVLKLASGLPAWGTDNDTIYSLPTSTTSTLGGVKLGSDTTQTTGANTVTTTASRTYAVQTNSSSQLLVNVPWTDTVYSLPTATTSTLGGVKLGSDTTQTTGANTVSSTASRTYAVQMNASNQLVANVPWTDTVYSLPTSTTGTLGGVKLGSDTTQTTAANAVSTTASRTYAVQTNSSGQLVINVPWVDTDTNTTYSNGTGLSLTGTTFSVDYGSTSTTACRGDDSRLSNSRNAADVYAWAKAASKPSYSASEVGALSTGGGTLTGNITYGDSNRNNSVIGTYDSTKTQQIWAMGAAYLNAADGANFGSLYGIAYKYNGDAGGHGQYCVQNGVATAGLGDGVWTSGNVTAYSDERLKTNWQDLPENFVAQLAEVKNGVYDRIDNGMTQVGVSAQSLQKVLPNAVIENEQFLSVAYGNAALVSAVELAKEMVNMRKLIEQLSTKVEDLQNQLANK